MRCPKCNYISFDILEKCVKCGKKIRAASEELKGTVASMAPPGFLKIDFTEPRTEAVEESTEVETEEAFDLGLEEEEVVVDFTAEEGPAVEAEATEMEIGEAYGGEEPEAGEASIDIADLAPSEDEELVAEATSEEFAFATEEEQPPLSEQGVKGLEDLKVEGIDLESSPAPPSGRDKAMPSVKTGTALDDFDVDLGDLMPKKKK
ncbi:MAG: hypothetical protein ACWGN1_05880 [Desulfobulbales bacterium]